MPNPLAKSVMVAFHTPISAPENPPKRWAKGVVRVTPGTASRSEARGPGSSLCPRAKKSPGTPRRRAPSVALVEESMAMKVPAMKVTARTTPRMEENVLLRLRMTSESAKRRKLNLVPRGQMGSWGNNLDSS